MKHDCCWTTNDTNDTNQLNKAMNGLVLLVQFVVKHKKWLMLNNELHETTKQGHERKRSANKAKSADTNMSHGFAKFAWFGERRRSLIPTKGVKFVVKTKNKVDDKRPFVVNGLFVAKQQIHGLKAQKQLAQGITLGWMRGGSCVL